MKSPRFETELEQTAEFEAAIVLAGRALRSFSHEDRSRHSLARLGQKLREPRQHSTTLLDEDQFFSNQNSFVSRMFEKSLLS
jgi:hypothetical protein